MAIVIPRVQLVPVSEEIASSYTKGGVGASTTPRAALLRLRDLRGGRMTPDAANGLLALSRAVQAAGGDLRVTDAFRDLDEQTKKRTQYEAALAQGIKKPYVARPGRSNHNAGRAIDIHVAALKLSDDPSNLLDVLWPIALAHGWRPIIKAPDERASESWHFDYWGEWAPVLDRIGYEQASMCACLDVGVGGTLFSAARERTVQANLQRAGYSIGDIDGIFGARTYAALEHARIYSTDLAVRLAKSMALPSSDVLVPV